MASTPPSTEGERFAWEITGVVDDGVDLAISWQATYDGVGVDPCNATVGAGAPVFFLPGGGSGGPSACCATTPRVMTSSSASRPARQARPTQRQPDRRQHDLRGQRRDDHHPGGRRGCDGGPCGPAGQAARSQLLDRDCNGCRVRVPTPTLRLAVGTDDPAPARRAVVDTGECLKCHVGSLYQHGGNRVDNVDMCIALPQLGLQREERSRGHGCR